MQAASEVPNVSPGLDDQRHGVLWSRQWCSINSSITLKQYYGAGRPTLGSWPRCISIALEQISHEPLQAPRCTKEIKQYQQ